MFRVKRLSKPTSKRPPNDNYTGTGISIKMNLPKEYWLDFKKRELVMVWTNGEITRFPVSDARFKEWVEEGITLKNL